jgi:periplasmic mercuric ion binding protein
MKKTLSRITAILIFVLAFSRFITAQEAVQESKYKEIEIKTTAQCGMCKERIEEAVNDLDGIQKADLDVETKVLTVNYDPEEVDSEDIRKAVTRVGYDADDNKASKRAYKKLPKCCQLGGHK